MTTAATGTGKAKRKFLTPAAIQSVQGRPMTEFSITVAGKEWWLRGRPVSMNVYQQLQKEATVVKERKVKLPDGEEQTIEEEEIDDALYMPRVIAACCCTANGEPAYTLEQAEELMDKLSVADFAELFGRCAEITGTGGVELKDALDTFPAGE